MTLLFLITCFLILLVIASFGVEALRRRPNAPTTLYWAPKIPIQTATIGSNTIRYIKTGNGPNLVLLHTLRTQLDIFEKLVPLLSKSFTVYALDYPGHGFSDIPKTDYDPDLFVKAVEGFLDKLDLKAVTLAGISIGGVIPLLIAVRLRRAGLTGLGMTVFAIIRARAEALYPATLVIRAFFLVCMSAFFLMTRDPLFLVLLVFPFSPSPLFEAASLAAPAMSSATCFSRMALDQSCKNRKARVAKAARAAIQPATRSPYQEMSNQRLAVSSDASQIDILGAFLHFGSSQTRD